MSGPGVSANGGPPEPENLPPMDENMFPPSTLIRQLRKLARTQTDWNDIVSALTTLGSRLPAGRAPSALRAIGLPLGRVAADALNEDIIDGMVGAFLVMELPELTPPPAGFDGAWNTAGCTAPRVFMAVVVSKINGLVTRWANAHLDDYTAAPIPLTGGGGGAMTAALTAATAAASAAAAVGTAVSGGKQIVQASTDGTWPETDVLLCHSDPAFVCAQTAVGNGIIEDFVKTVTNAPYSTLSQGAQLLLWALITRTPTLKVSDSKSFKNSDERQELYTTVIKLTAYLGTPAMQTFSQNMLGIRPPSLLDQRAAWELASTLNPKAWGTELGAFSSSETVRAKATDSLFTFYLAYETSLEGLITFLAGSFPWLVSVPKDLNVLRQHAQTILTKPSFARVVPLESERKLQFHTLFVTRILDTMRANLTTTLETASLASSASSLSTKHGVAQLSTLLDEVTGKELCPEAHAFLGNPAGMFQAGLAVSVGASHVVASGGKGKSAFAIESPHFHAAVDSRARSVAHAALRASSPLPAQTSTGGLQHQGTKRKIETPAGTPGPKTTTGAPEADPMNEPIRKKRPGDPVAWYAYYRKRTQEILTQAKGRTFDKVQCPQEAYLESRFCPAVRKCEAGRMFLHLKNAGKTRVEGCGCCPRDLAMIANEFCGSEGYERMPENFAPVRMRREVKAFLDHSVVMAGR